MPAQTWVTLTKDDSEIVQVIAEHAVLGVTGQEDDGGDTEDSGERESPPAGGA